MNKDVIYIDVDDDITAIIGKVKASTEKIVALVPPKRVGVLQSAVNLRLLERTATQADKRMVLITNNQALVALSAAAGIPVAKNLQSRPELAEIPALEVDDDDVIDGSQLPVGDHAKTAEHLTSKGPDEASSDKEVIVPIEGLNLDEPADKKPTRKKPAAKIPNFSTFRKKLFIGIAALILLIGTLVWAFVFAPAATVIVTARTTPIPVSTAVQLGSETDAADAIIRATVQTIERDASVEFRPTGSETVGERASGSVVFRNCDTSSATTVPSGTYIAHGGRNFIIQGSVVVPGGNFAGGMCVAPGVSAEVTVIATDIGSEFNKSSGTSFTVSGYSSSMTARNPSAITGGSSREVTIVTAEDVQTASESLVEQSDDDVRAELQARFGDGYIVLEDSFTIDRAEAASSPAIGQQAEGNATLTSKVTYRLTAVSEADLDGFLSALLKEQLEDQTAQNVYDSGAEAARFSQYSRDGDVATVRLATTGQIGPVIDEDKVREQVAGKRYGEVQSTLQQIDGVSDVDVQFSYFWVRTVPNNTEKISIEFELQNAEN